ncbi:actin-histidine N-methyltransferase [Impatiens glandulifera]|uniref:actin-histidine N-methyltransferase n=1 Tax=Impatiens glandulifera TaxID=253017 RepID=UPI001FB0E1F6|nr:actin-histidine N-methyltransferase [Impatiens glandulifera]
MMSSSSSKAMVTMAIRDLHLLTSTTCITHRRLLTCAATSAVSAFSSGRLVPQPPDLIKWVKREGGFVHPSIKIAQTDPHGFGLVASEEIPKGSDLISLPPHVPLRFDSDRGDNAASYSVLVNLSRQVPEELWAMRLGLKLLQERAKKGSFWWPYISNLPDTYTVPIFFSGEDIKNLQYAPLLHQVNKRCRFLLEFDKSVRQMLEDVELDEHPFGGQDVDASSLGWAMSAVSSRAFRLYGEKLSDGNRVNLPMMLPLVDMCNHSFNPNANIVQELSGGDKGMLVKVVAEMKIQRDEPLLLNYGCLNNDLFLLDYGFVITSNPYDCIELKYNGGLLDAASMAAGVSSPNFSSPTPYQHHILSQLNLTGETSLLKVTIGGRDMVEGRLLAALRVFLANDEETAKKIELDTLMSLSVEAPLGKETEIAVLRTMIALCVIALGHFPTKLTEDESLLKKNGVSSSTELALRFRIEKKSVIINVMRDLTRKVKSLLPDNSSANS